MQGLRSQHFEKMRMFLGPKNWHLGAKMSLYAVLPTLLLLLVY